MCTTLTTISNQKKLMMLMLMDTISHCTRLILSIIYNWISMILPYNVTGFWKLFLLENWGSNMLFRSKKSCMCHLIDFNRSSLTKQIYSVQLLTCWRNSFFWFWSSGYIIFNGYPWKDNTFYLLQFSSLFLIMLNLYFEPIMLIKRWLMITNSNSNKSFDNHTSMI